MLSKKSARTRSMSFARAMITFALIAVISGLVIAPLAVINYGVSPVAGFAIGFGGMIALLFFLVVYNLVRMRVQLALLRNESRDLALARACGGLDGGLMRHGPITLWVSGPRDWAPTAIEQFDETRNRFAALVGERIAVETPIRAILFADREWFLEYARRARLVLPPSLDGFFLAGKPGKIVAGMPNPFKRLAPADRFLRLLFGYYFLNAFKGFPVHSWLNVGVGSLLARNPTADEQARLNRKVLPAVQGLRETVSSRDLFRRTPRIIFHSRLKPGGQAEYARIVGPLNHAQSVLDFLAGREATPDRMGSFRIFLKSIQRKDNYDAVFRRHFGYGLDQLYNNWREWVLANGMGDHEPPPAVIRQALLETIIPLVSDRDVVPEERIQAIRDMGNAGYVLGADALIDLVRDRDREIRAAAVWALEMISGTAGGEDMSHWESWWDRLPREAEAVFADESSSPPDPRLFRKES